MPDANKLECGPPSAEFAWRVHGYTNDYIRFADAKAGAVITWSAGLIAILVALKAHRHFMDAQFGTDWTAKATILCIGTLLAFALLSAAVVCAFWVVKPRLWSTEARKGHDKGLIYWEMVRAHGSPAAYATAVQAASPSELAKASAEHTFVLGGIASRKFSWVDRSIIVGAAGSFLAGLVALFSA